MNKEKQVPGQPEKGKSSFSTIEWYLKLFALIGIIVSLVGYGVVLGLANAINLDHGSILGSPFELLTLVWPGVLIMLTALQKVDFLSIIGDSFSKALPVLWITFISAAGYSIFLRYKGLLTKISKIWLESKVVPNEYESALAAFLKSCRLAICAYAIAIIGHLAILIGVLGILVCLLTIPMAGFVTGKTYFHEFVLKPKHCVAIEPSSARLKDKTPASSETGATCVVLTSIDPMKPYSNFGRVVLSSSTYMLIYHSETGVGERIPIAGLVITSIDDEGIKKLKKEDAKQAPLIPNQ